MAKKYLDSEGVKVFWAKSKQLVETLKTQLQNGTVIVSKSANATNAETADSATKATQDGNGRIIADTYILNSSKGVASGVATLDTAGKVPASQLPGFVDDVLEYTSKTAFPATGETGKIYIDTDTNLQYRWSGTQYIIISASLALGETSSTAYPGDKGKKNADDIASLKTSVSNLNTNKLDKEASQTNGVYVFDNSGANVKGLSVEFHENSSKDGEFSAVALTKGSIAIFAGSDATSRGTAPCLIIESDGSVTFTNINSIANDNGALLDESMAITTEELNAILV